MQATENSVYADATFYYAEAEKVECLVDVYGDELKNKDSVIRDRFVEDNLNYTNIVLYVPSQ